MSHSSNLAGNFSFYSFPWSTHLICLCFPSFLFSCLVCIPLSFCHLFCLCSSCHLLLLCGVLLARMNVFFMGLFFLSLWVPVTLVAPYAWSLWPSFVSPLGSSRDSEYSQSLARIVIFLALVIWLCSPSCVHFSCILIPSCLYPHLWFLPRALPLGLVEWNLLAFSAAVCVSLPCSFLAFIPLVLSSWAI